MADSTNSTPSRTRQLADFFQSRPDEWHDGAGILAEIGGRYAWRSRVSDARRLLGLSLRNRQRLVRRTDGARYVISEYSLVSGPAEVRRG